MLKMWEYKVWLSIEFSVKSYFLALDNKYISKQKSKISPFSKLDPLQLDCELSWQPGDLQ